jgi:hypothetical protein
VTIQLNSIPLFISHRLSVLICSLELDHCGSSMALQALIVDPVLINQIHQLPGSIVLSVGAPVLFLLKWPLVDRDQIAGIGPKVASGLKS